MGNKDTSKQWFETGDYPTQAQFYQVFDWLRWKDEGITITDVAALQGILDSIQNTLNSVLPNQLISGGNVSIDTDDGTTLSIHIPETKYKLKGAPYTQAAGTFNLALRPAAGLFRIDVFYLDATGFHVVTGATGATPVKPGVPDGSLELSNILIGFDNMLDVSAVPDTPDLSAVLAAGNEATRDIILNNRTFVTKNTNLDRAVRVSADGIYYDDNVLNKHMHIMMPNPLTSNQSLSLPDKSGTFALLNDLATKADLAGGKVPASQLPSYVDDVIEGRLASTTSFETNDGSGWVAVTPEQGKIYVDVTTDPSLQYRWSGSVYVQIGEKSVWGAITGTLSNQTDLNTILGNKVDKVTGKQLSSEDYTIAEKNKLASITEIFTTALKTAYDNVVTWISTNGANLLSHLLRTDNPHNVTAAQIGVEAGAQVNDPNTTIQGNTFNTANKLVQLDGDGKLPAVDGSRLTGIISDLSWNTITADTNAAPDNGYVADSPSLVTLTLPATIAKNKTVRMVGKGTGGWKIAQNANQVIHFAGYDTTTGTGGNIASTDKSDSVELLCTVANTEFVVISSQGNITLT